MVSESIVCLETSGHCWAVGHREPESAVWPCQSSTKTAILGGELGALGPGPSSKPQKTVDPILQTAIFGQDLNFPILTCRTTSQPINLRKCTAFSPVFYRYKWNACPVPLGLGCGVYPIRRGLGFTPAALGDPHDVTIMRAKACNLRSALRQTKTKEPNDVRILKHDAS